MIANLVQQTVHEAPRQEVLIRQLLECAKDGPDYDEKNNPFTWAARAEHLDLIDYLISVTRGFKIIEFILTVAREGQKSVLRHLLGKHRQGATNQVLLAQLLDYYASRPYVDDLISAAEAGHIALVDFLLEIMGRDTALVRFSRAIAGSSEAALGLMVGRLLARSLRELGTRTEETILRGLLQYRASPTKGLLLAWATENRNVALKDFLADIGKDLNRISALGILSPLVGAARRGHASIVDRLLTRGADVETKNTGWTALGFAIFHGREAVVKVLLKHGATVSPHKIRWAKERGQDNMVALLVGREEAARNMRMGTNIGCLG